jgi:hypothetical protein
MKPKSKKEAWLFKHFKDPTNGDDQMLDRDVRRLRKMWKRKRTKMLRRIHKRVDNER